MASPDPVLINWTRRLSQAPPAWPDQQAPTIGNAFIAVLNAPTQTWLPLPTTYDAAAGQLVVDGCVATFLYAATVTVVAFDAIGRAEMAPVNMRYFAAQDTRPTDYCRTRVRSCQVYVAIVGFRYGSILSGEKVSCTEVEFLEAGRAGLPRLVFLLAKPGCPPRLADADRGPISEFRQRLCDTGLIVRRFTSAAELELEVFHALSQLRTGRLPAFARTELSARTLVQFVRGIRRLLMTSANSELRHKDHQSSPQQQGHAHS
jgi:hypothetical protein